MLLNNKKILVFFTGGTICMSAGQDGTGVAPTSDFGNLLDVLSPQPDVSSHPVEWSNKPSPHMTPEDMLQLARDLDHALADDQVHGAVVLHGTDLLVETSFVLDIAMESPKPVVTTGSMRHLGESGYDGIRNLKKAVTVCLAMPQHSSILVQMADWLYNAADAVKLDSLAVSPIAGQRLGTVGRVVGDTVCFTRRPRREKDMRFPVKDMSVFVPLITCFPGMDGTIVRAVIDAGAKGLVMEGFGAGNIPPGAEDAVLEAMDAGLPVVLTTRCIKGGVWPVYGYKGGAAALMNKGAISAGPLSGTKSQLLLKAALGSKLSREKIVALFETRVCNDGCTPGH